MSLSFYYKHLRKKQLKLTSTLKLDILRAKVDIALIIYKYIYIL